MIALLARLRGALARPPEAPAPNPSCAFPTTYIPVWHTSSAMAFALLDGLVAADAAGAAEVGAAGEGAFKARLWRWAGGGAKKADAAREQAKGVKGGREGRLSRWFRRKDQTSSRKNTSSHPYTLSKLKPKVRPTAPAAFNPMWPELHPQIYSPTSHLAAARATLLASLGRHALPVPTSAYDFSPSLALADHRRHNQRATLGRSPLRNEWTPASDTPAQAAVGYNAEVDVRGYFDGPQDRPALAHPMRGWIQWYDSDSDEEENDADDCMDEDDMDTVELQKESEALMTFLKELGKCAKVATLAVEWEKGVSGERVAVARDEILA